MRKTHLYKILFLVSYWTLAAVFYVSFEAAILNTYAPIGRPHDFSISLVVAILGTILPSTAIASFEILYFNKLLRRKPFGITLIIKTSFYLISIFVFSSIAILATDSLNLDKSIFHSEVIDLFLRYLSSPGLIMMMVFWGLAVMSGIFIIQISDKFGQGVLVNFLLGRYHSPKEEVRIFMFMDLKSSTSYAEEHGHIKYSHLIQDCFYDLTDIVLKYEATIYQYVGDEIVLTWETDKGMKNNNCINTFFAYELAIKKKGTYYKNNYGVIPEFKASVNMGQVTVAEVGELKKEIAYHGDVVNTAARIQEKCTEFKAKLLISEDVRMQINNNSNYKFDLIKCGLKLKGKNKLVCVFAVNNDHLKI